MSKSRVIGKLGSFPDKEPYKFPFGKCVKAEKKGYFDTCLFSFYCVPSYLIILIIRFGCRDPDKNCILQISNVLYFFYVSFHTINCPLGIVK